MKIAIQLYTLRNETAENLEKVLEEVKKMGYDGVELAGLCGHTADEVKAMLEKHGLEAISAHIGVGDCESIEKLNGYKTIGCKYGVVPGTKHTTEENKDEILGQLKMCFENLVSVGLIPGYHNHDWEFKTEFDGEKYIDILYKTFPEIKTELDLCWVKVGGSDPCEYIKKYNGRTEILHVKDFVGKGYVVCSDGSQPKMPLASELDFDQRPVGYGVVGAEEIVETAKACGTEWLVVELDTPAKDTTPMECAAESIKYLKGLV